MKITKLGICGKVTKGRVKEYRQNPAVLEGALVAAKHYAGKNGAPMVVLAGNSYGSALWHIARASDSLAKYGIVGDTCGYVVDVDGAIYRAELARDLL